MRGALAAQVPQEVEMAGRWVQMWFPAAWADPGSVPELSRARRRSVHAVAHRMLAQPVQYEIPVVRLFEFEQPASRRKCSPFARARTMPLSKLGDRRGDSRTRELWDVDLEALRPKTRGDCINGPRPCPWIGCEYHLAISVDPERGSVKETFPRLEILNHPEGEGLVVLEGLVGTCALDVADRHDDGTGTSGLGGLLALRQAAMSGKPLGNTPGLNIEETGRRFNLSIERTRQISSAAMQELRVKLRREPG